MVLKVFGFSRSSNTQRVLLLLKETRLPYEWHDIDLAKGAHKAPAFLAQHPFGQVPYLVRSPVLGAHCSLTPLVGRRRLRAV
jgi:glutathione S-transferase